MQRTAPLILIVNHDAATLAVCEELLRSAGYTTIGCQTAREAQRHIHTDQPDLLLEDLHLEWYEAGWDLLCLLRQEQATAALPVIMCSADRQRLPTRLRQLQAWQCQILEKSSSTRQLVTPYRRHSLWRRCAAGPSGKVVCSSSSYALASSAKLGVRFSRRKGHHV